MTKVRKRKFPRVSTVIEGPALTKQAHKGECDINLIMSRYERQGVIDHLNRFGGNYGDFTMAPSSYHEALEIVRRAGEMFMDLPAKVRARFDNDPGTFVEFAEDPANLGELRELGLAPAAPASAPVTEDRSEE